MADKLSRGINAKLHTRETVVTAEQARKLNELTVKVDVDVSEALTGLKALQREARKATQALKDTETASMNANSIRESLFDDLSAILSQYVGVENTEDNRKKLRADVVKTIYGTGGVNE